MGCDTRRRDHRRTRRPRGRDAGDPARPAGGLRLHSRGCHPDGRNSPQPVARRGPRRLHLLPRFPGQAGRAPRAETVPGGGVPGRGRRRAGRTCRGEVRHHPRQYDGRSAADAGADLLPRALRDGALGHARRSPDRTARRGAYRCDRRGDTTMTLRIFVSCDAGAVAVGADEVALVLGLAADKRGIEIEIVRTGSRGLYWLEPMIEVATPRGRIAFGPVTEFDASSVFDAMISDGAHPLQLGITEEIPWLKRQTRLTFARCGVVDPRSIGDYEAHDGYKGLVRALELGPDAIIAEVTASGL